MIQPLSQKEQCPYCHQQDIKRDGSTIKGAQRFFCYNCNRYWQDSYVRATSRNFQEQKELFAWAQMHPILFNHLLTISDGGGQLKPRQNLPTGRQACDILLAYPVSPYHGLWIKLKTGKAKAHRSEPTQTTMHALKAVGYDVKIAHGWQEAANEIKSYLGGKFKAVTHSSSHSVPS